MIESGPAAGALAAAYAGRRAGRPDLLSFDMGGTTAKACLVEGGQPLVAAELEVDRVYRFKKGSGLPIRCPAVELIEIGAGGGSIARVDTFGLIKVGPESAGARPGPACYGLMGGGPRAGPGADGGASPTVTDADLVLGYLDPGYFLGGRLPLHRHLAEEALRERIAAAPGAGPARRRVGGASGGERADGGGGADARRGEGQGRPPLPALRLRGRRPGRTPAGWRGSWGCGRCSCPFGAGVGSTVGLLAAPLAFDFVRSDYALLEGADWSAVAAHYAEMEGEGMRLLAQAGVAPQEVTLRAHGGHAPLRAGPPDLRAHPRGSPHGGDGPGRAGQLRGGLPHPVPARPARGGGGGDLLARPGGRAAPGAGAAGDAGARRARAGPGRRSRGSARSTSRKRGATPPPRCTTATAWRRGPRSLARRWWRRRSRRRWWCPAPLA